MTNASQQPGSGNAAGLGRRSEQILSRLRAELDAGGWAVGARLPTETELCRQFNTSKSTVRRAMDRLVREGRVVRRRGSGTYVQSPPPRTHRSQVISVMFPVDRPDLIGIQRLALQRGYLLSAFVHDDWSPRTERLFLRRVLEERHHALLAFCTPHPPDNGDLLAELDEVGVRVLHLGYYRPTPPDQAYLLPDYQWGAFVGVSRLLVAGYDRIYFAGLHNDGPYAQPAHAGFLDALRQHGRPADRQRTFIAVPEHVDCTPQPSFEAALDRLLVPGVGLLCRSVDLATVFHRAALARGLRVPDDVGVIGISHLIGSTHDHDAIDRIDYPWSAMLEEAIAQVMQPHWQPTARLVEPTFVARGTTRSRPAIHLPRAERP